MAMDMDRKKELKEQYKNRHPELGIVAWKYMEQIWVWPSKDTKSDYNRTSFQLKLGSWPNKEMQSAYNQNPELFEWCIEEILEYEDTTEDYSDDLMLMLMDYLNEHPEAKIMKPLKK